MSIFGQYAYSSSYKDIADALQVKPKTVDNALMRIRKKSSETYQYYLETHSQINLGFSSIGTAFGTSFFVETLIGFTTNLSVV